MDKFLVIRDSQEKMGHGWRFNKTSYCKGTITRKIKTGDYSLEGYEDIFTIERKGSISEFAHNVIEKRFDREIERMAHIKHSFILLEFDASTLVHYPVSARIPRYKLKYVKINGKYIVRRISEIMIQYPNIKIMFCGKYGKEITRSLFKRIVQYEKK